MPSATAAWRLFVEVALKAMPNLMPQNDMRGLFTRDDHALFGGDMPNRAGHWGCDVSLFTSHANGFGADLGHILANLPAQIHLFHDPLVCRFGRELVKLCRRYQTAPHRLTSRQDQQDGTKGSEFEPTLYRHPMAFKNEIYH